MAKQTRTKVSRKKTSKPIIPEKYQDLAYCAALIVAILVFFHEVTFGGGSFLANDNIASLSFNPYLEQAEERGEFPQWMPYVFSGFPGYSAQLFTGDRWWDIISNFFFGIASFLGVLFSNDTVRVLAFYMIYAVGMYMLMRVKGQTRFVAFFTAFAAVFSTLVISWVMIGHNTKPANLMTLPYILICVFKLREKFSVLYTALLIIAVHILFDAGYVHYQVAYYILLALAVYVIFHLVNSVISKQGLSGVGRIAGLLLLAGTLAFAMGSDRFLSNMSYIPYSTRGSTPIEKLADSEDTKPVVGDYEYSTSYSFDPAEISTFFVPNFYGYGRLQYDGPELRSPEPIRLYTYWGTKPISDAPNYMGIGIVFLAVLGIFWYWREESFIRYLVILSVLALFLSFGYHISFLYDLFYYNVPGFNKFRAPELVLILVQFSAAILAGYGVAGLLRLHRQGASPEQRKTLLLALGGAAFFLVLGFIYSAAFKDSYIAGLSPIYQGRQYPASIAEFMYDEMINDWFITGLLALAFMGTAYLFVIKKIRSTVVFCAIFAALLIIDLWRVDYRAMEVSDQKFEEFIPETDVIRFISQDTTLYRVADFNQQNTLAYFNLQNIHGYSSAKLRIYQDLMDVAGKAGGTFINNPFLWNLLNVKYIVFPQEIPGQTPLFQSRTTGQRVYPNQTMLPRVFFVNSVAVEDSLSILHHVRDGDFDPRELAYVERALPVAIEAPQPAAQARITEYKNESITIDVNATGNNLLFISEVYYPQAWKAFLDGKETEIFKTNFAFRSVIVPPGQHTLELRFIDDSFQTGMYLSQGGTALTLALLVLAAVLAWRQRRQST